MQRFEFPDGKRFAFTIIDDTDVATVENVKPVYTLLHRLGMRATKTVWPVGCPEGSRNFNRSQTLEDPAYLEFVLDLKRKGFEITWHGATMESSSRERILLAWERFRSVFGYHPRIHINHSENRDNLYWGPSRIDGPLLKWMLEKATGVPATYYGGHDESSPYWWGDLAREHVEYVRNLTYNGINTARYNPTMPYQDPKRPLARWWFSASDAETVAEFNELLHPRNQDELEEEGGFCIVATHFGKGFVRDGKVHPVTQERLEELASRNGWFPNAGELLDWLRERQTTHVLPKSEWRSMQWRWAWDTAQRAWEKW